MGLLAPKYDIRYKAPGTLLADKRAEKDAKAFLGAERLKIVIEMIEGQECSIRQMRNWIAFAGIQGYPASALLRLHHPRYVRRFKGKR